MSDPRVMRDLVVVLPGILGSTLAKHGKLVWAPSAGSVLRAIRSFGRSITNLGLPEGIGDDHPGDDVTASGLMPISSPRHLERQHRLRRASRLATVELSPDRGLE